MSAPVHPPAPSIATAIRPSWDELPPSLRGGLADQLGPIAAVETQTGGFTPGLALRLQLTNGQRVFIKGIPADHALVGKYRAEATTARHLPITTPAPRLRWSADMAGWVVLAFDDVDGRHADLSPSSSDLGPVVATIAVLAEVLTPCAIPNVPPATVELAELVHGWGELATAPPTDLDDWTRRHLRELATLETQWLSAAEGETLLHGDINQSNLLLDSARTVVLVDWAQPARGAAWIDIADLIPHLILAGHTPTAAEEVIAEVPAWHDADPVMITSYAAAFAGYWARNSRHPAPPGVPHLRAHQARAAKAATTWVAHRTNWL